MVESIASVISLDSANILKTSAPPSLKKLQIPFN